MRAKDYPRVEMMGADGAVICTRPMTKGERETYDRVQQVKTAQASGGMVRVPLVGVDGLTREVQVPEDVFAAANALVEWAAKNNMQGAWSIYGIGDVHAARRDALTKAQDAISRLRG